MRKIEFKEIVNAIAELCIKINYELDEDVIDSFTKSLAAEKSPVGREVLELLIKNAKIAKDEQVPMCQDTGTAVVFIELGQDVIIKGGNLTEAVEEGVRKGYLEGYLRKSMCNPFTRANTGDNCPPIIHTQIVPGDRLAVSIAAKGGGSENMSRLAMLTPSEGIEGIKKFVIETVDKAGPNPCPPLVVGIGVGGNFETCAILAKKALMRKLGEPSKDETAARLEKELLSELNKTGIGPSGFGGTTTVIGVHIDVMPCHIASFPVAVNLNCHAARHGKVVL
ncbi:fumarate hydratase [Desulfitibacter alkalitolerans]|uniref:fumarate hydratase n=1 Tax=Desulfitibacter alkalitolerans TaxID=264641 RepID=UPI0004831F67|nr:fumarate hydratase [Desulfitibacter alkalitolerans]